ncbi:SDR family oxidoreductase [[Erwinia] mediterraneensis]|uniref:SDR family oxidoreductase n=1 Tax=[Erwinia] mediterraneensis TaxID=2161819 RepID=UPI0010311F0A|nr:SDR family oxidoreductase [[Erwinia] mediterraneensis]
MSKSWLITGASAGLGRLLSEKLLARGDRVFATVRKAGVLDELQRQYGSRLSVFTLDLTDTDGLRTAVAQAFARTERIDVVVSNAGYGLFGAAEELNDAQIARQIATNLTGSIQLIRAVIPWLRQQGGGRIMQLSSEGGQTAYPNFSLYHATKWGIEGFIESVAQEVADFGIDFILVEPGPTGTQFASNLDYAPALASYEHNASGAMRRALESGSFEIKGDIDKTVETMMAFAGQAHPPLRLPLGSIAYTRIHQALSARLAALEQLRAIACAADITPEREGH